ncbi:MAG: serine/threonine-protein kinase, partial [Thermoguttaceae bacterium]
MPIEVARPSSAVSSSSADQGRFIPGTVLAKRYRIIGLLGRGGMGEVYRADDLKLGQPVALKFLPRGLEKDEGRLQRFLNEVRMALKVSHPNVCRVHDIGEFEGQHFISMEYVDGEDLASLLRRIGRLPKNKAIQAARQLCAGLATAHDQGVLHRDLKPANVMIDGRGQVKITDFGLAGLDDSIEGAEARAGTPAYMAPEQWAGKEVTHKSDLFALGLVLYELFTGEQPYEGKTPAEIVQIQEESSPTTPSSLVEGFDPAVERVILTCLEKDPAQRPPSVVAVAAALPGGDPLAAALAAGETPSPELVAQAGGAESVSPKMVIGLLLAALVFTALWVALARQTQLVGYLDLQKSPEVLVARAQEILSDFGYTEAPGDSLFDFQPNNAYLGHIDENDESPDRWDRLGDSQPAALHFRYRQSPQEIVKESGGSIGEWMEDPAMTRAGEAMLVLDPNGRLLSFMALPPERLESASEPPLEPDWQPILSAAGLDPADLVAEESTWVPPVYADSRAAWVGTYPDAPDIEIRIEAAAFQGRPVAMRLLEPWNRTRAEETAELAARTRTSVIVQHVTFDLMILAAIFVAWRNLRLGRGDRKTAFRFALYLGLVRLLWVVGAHHVAAQGEGMILWSHYAFSTWRIFIVWIFYIAIEPYARRLWPHVLVTWVRFVGGRWRDPLVGRDILIGVATGAFLTNLGWLSTWLFPRLTGMPGPPPDVELSTLEALRRGAHLVAALAIDHTTAVLINSLFIVLLLVILRLVLRRTWLAVAAAFVVAIGAYWPAYSSPTVHLIFTSLNVAIFLGILFRYGFLSIVVSNVVWFLLTGIPITYQVSSWTFGGTVVALAGVFGLAI